MDIKVTLENGNVLKIEKGSTVRELIRKLNIDNLIAIRINGVAVDADYEIDKDVYVNFITTDDRTGRKIYTKGLEYVYITAINELYGPEAVVEMKHSLDKFIYTELSMKRKVDANVVKKIKDKMNEIIAADEPIKNVSVSRKDAYDYSENNGEYEKCLNYTYLTNESVTMYELMDSYNYFYYIMPASTGILKTFDLI